LAVTSQSFGTTDCTYLARCSFCQRESYIHSLTKRVPESHVVMDGAMRVVALTWLTLTHGQVTGEQCNSVPRSSATTEWCKQSCAMLLAFVRMRMPYETMDFNALLGANKMNTWAVCPSAFRSIVFARLAHEIKQLQPDDLPSVERRIRVAEHAAREFVTKNITGYLEAGTSFAPWFHLGTVFEVIKENFSAVFSRQEQLLPTPKRNAIAEVLQRSLDSDAPTMGPMQMLREQGWRSGDFQGSDIASLERAALLLAEADFVRVSKAYGIPGSGGLMGAARDEMNHLLNLGQKFLLQSYLHAKAAAPAGLTDLYGLFTAVWQTGVPIFEILDRLDSQVLESIFLPTSQTHSDAPFLVHVLPTRNVESNHVRAFFDLHCDQTFKDLVEKHKNLRQPLMVVEIGTHLGGCVLYALTHLPKETRALAIDAYGPAVAALRRTAASNGLADRLTVVEQFVCPDDKRRYSLELKATGPAMVQPAWTETAADAASEMSGPKPVECRSLDAIFMEYGILEVDLMRIHVLGREYDALRSGERFFANGKVKVLAGSVSQQNTKPGKMAEMLFRALLSLSEVPESLENCSFLECKDGVRLEVMATLCIFASFETKKWCWCCKTK
ncbi:unnamed protein product, partial [Durusdinium trenchii]